MISQPDQQAITIDIQPNFSRSKGKEAMKFPQVIKNKKIYIFLQKSCRK